MKVIFCFENITVLLDDGLYVPSISTLNELRRTALEKVEQEILNRVKKDLPNILEDKKETITFSPVNENPEISLLLRKLDTNFDYTKLDKEKICRIYLPLNLLANKNYFEIINYFSKNYELYIYMPTIIKTNYKNIVLNV